MFHIYITSDHAGCSLKEQLILELSPNKNYIITDLGPFNDNRCDYPDYAKKLVNEMKETIMKTFGIVICGTGIGMSIACNRFSFIRCALCHNQVTAMMTRKHNDANVLALGARILDKETSLSIVNTFLQTEFEGGRHIDRINKL